MLEVGRITKPHGVRGDVLVVLTTTRPERVDVGSVLATDQGELRVVASKPHNDRHIVHFAGVDSRELADELRGVVLQAEPIEDDDVMWVHDLIGSKLVEADGTERGIIESVEDNPASDLLVLDSGALVPMNFIVEYQPGSLVVVQVPDGLFDQ